MTGWFESSAPGTCDQCGRRTKSGERVYYPAGMFDLRLCGDCGKEVA
jgi:hypothetical protein